MIEVLAQIFFGWPAIIASIVLSIYGIIARKPWLIVLGAVLFIMPSLYLSGYPSIRGLGLLLPVFVLVAAYAVKKNRQGFAWILISPMIMISAVLAYLVITQ
jgi:hypothetical protein